MRSSPTTDYPIIDQNINHNKKQKEEEVGLIKKEMEEDAKKQHQAPPLDPSTRKMADSLTNNIKPSGSHFDYEPRRKHASPIDNDFENTNMISSMENNKDIQRPRRTLQEDIISRSSVALSTCSNDDTLELERYVHSMLSTGSIRGIEKTTYSQYKCRK